MKYHSFPFRLNAVLCQFNVEDITDSASVNEWPDPKFASMDGFRLYRATSKDDGDELTQARNDGLRGFVEMLYNDWME